MSDGNIIFIDAHFIFKGGRKTRDGCTNSSFSVNLYSLSSKVEKIIHNWMKHFLEYLNGRDCLREFFVDG
jgi:hypothetical protein